MHSTPHRRVLDELCAESSPEHVNLSGRYEPGVLLSSWADVRAALEGDGCVLFDRYFEGILVPRLRTFEPQVVGLSLPFDWMLLPAMHLVRHLRSSIQHAHIVVGGPAVTRLWSEGESGFFNLIGAQWAAVGPGELALADLVENVAAGAPPKSGRAREAPHPISSGQAPNTVSQNRRRLHSGPRTRLLGHGPAAIPASRAASARARVRRLFLRSVPILLAQREDGRATYRERAPGDVAAVMRSLAHRIGSRQFVLAGDNFTHSFLKQVSRELAAQDMTWSCEVSFKSQLAGQLSVEDCAANFPRWVPGRPQRTRVRLRPYRRLMGCSTAQDAYDQTILRLASAGIVPLTTLIVGFPGETLRDLAATIAYVQTHRNACVFAMSRFQVVAGTPLERQLQRGTGRILPRRSVLDGGALTRVPTRSLPRTRKSCWSANYPGCLDLLRSLYAAFPS